MLRPWQTQFWLENSSGKTLHAKLMNQLISDIKNGRLTPGSMLPGSRTLAKELKINRKTVQQVYEELEAQGWLVTKPRSGTRVSETLPEHTLTISDKRLVSSTSKAKIPSELIETLYHEAVGSLAYSAITNDGVPDARLIPYELIARTYRRVCVGLRRTQNLGYSDPRGTLALRHSVRDMLSGDRYMTCSTEQICIVRGSQMGIFLASRVLNPNMGAIVMEDLSYLPARAAFESNGFEVLNCEIDDQGLNIQCLQGILDKHQVAGIYVTPHHQYPTTVCLPIERRLALLELSRSYKFAVLEDDYDHEFHYDANPVPPLASLPNSENVIHIGSMSKVFAPGLRLGYIAADTTFIERIAQDIIVIDRQGNTLTELIIADLMESGEVNRHIRKTRKQYQARRDFAAREFTRVFGDSVSFKIPTGGLAIWVDISRLMIGKMLDNLGDKNSILNTLFTKEKTAPTHIRFGFGAINEDEITHSIEKLAEILNGQSKQA